MREKHLLPFQCKIGLLLWSKHVFCVDYYTNKGGEGINGYGFGGGGVNVNDNDNGKGYGGGGTNSYKHGGTRVCALCRNAD